MFIDTHAHLYAKEFDEDRQEMLKRAEKAGVKTLLLPNIDEESMEGMHQLMKDYPSLCKGMMGLHPSYVTENVDQQLEKIEHYLFHQSEYTYCAVGEIGIDLHWDKTFVEQQKKAFQTQVRWAKKLEIPIAIHARKAFQEIYEILDQENDSSLKGVFHCFGGSKQDAKKIQEYGGFKLGIGGVLTYKNAGLMNVLEHVSLDQLILETDAPYLSPEPMRGKRNESSFIPYIAEKLTAIYAVSIEKIAEETTRNAKDLFQLN
jgi:TatD DNase family protein